MKKLVLIFSFIFLPILLNAAVDLPNFSFVGNEIAKYEVKPTFGNVNVDFSAKTSFDTYLNKISLEIEGKISKNEYEGKDPGALYSGRTGTDLSSIFIGDKAFRNYFIKQYLKKDYIRIIDSYKKYKEYLKKPEYIDEVNFIYSLALVETGNFKEAEPILDNLSVKNSPFSEYASDKLMSYYYDLKKYDKLLSLFDRLDVASPHPLYLALQVLLKKNQFKKILEILNQYDFYKEKYPVFYDFEIISEYYLNNFDKVIALDKHSSDKTIFFIADAYLQLNNNSKISELTKKMKNEGMKNYFLAKSAIFDKEEFIAVRYVNNVPNENDRLNLLFYYLKKHFPDINVDFLKEFQLNSFDKDYINYYSGLYYLMHKQYDKAAESFQLVSFKKEFILQSVFYKGLAYFYINKNLSSYYLLTYINEGNDKEKLSISKYLLGQIKFLQNKYNEALIVLESCNTNLCKELTAEIYLKMKDIDNALEVLNDLNTDKSHYLKAVIFYNRKNFDSALEELSKIKKPNSQTQLLKMNIFFKNKHIPLALKIYENNKENIRFTEAAVKYLFLLSKFDKIMEILNEQEYLTPNLRLIKAKTLYSLGKYDKAEEMFNEFINENKFLFDSIYGLISIYQIKNSDKGFIKNSLELINKYDFEKKDYLIIELARLSLEKNEINTGIKLLNYFFKNYPNSPYITDAYLVKAAFFVKLKKYDECVMDMDSLLLKNKNNENALYQKAECLEKIDAKKAVDTYLELATNSKTFQLAAYMKISELSNDLDALQKAAIFFKNKDTQIYLKTVEKLLEIASVKSKPVNYSDMIYDLMDSNNEKYIPAGLYYMGIVQLNSKSYHQAARYALKVYYTFPKSKYAEKALLLAISAYIELGDKNSVKKLRKLINQR
jgi:tetratricopeptide (TPR) repeat protein